MSLQVHRKYNVDLMALSMSMRYVMPLANPSLSRCLRLVDKSFGPPSLSPLSRLELQKKRKEKKEERKKENSSQMFPMPGTTPFRGIYKIVEGQELDVDIYLPQLREGERRCPVRT